ncbi:MAG: TonB family protein [Bdellovibrionaceae bacterium]|nr:TonB family protein [Pseudobdellovibrionaceae bacterium]
MTMALSSTLQAALNKVPAWILSLSIHGLFVLSWVLLSMSRSASPRRVTFEVIENPKVSSVPIATRPIAQPPKAESKPKVERRAVFGLSQKAILAPDSDQSAVDVKVGNTIAKAPDQLQMQPGDVESLPIPVEDYLVSAMPILKSEVRIPYPEEARKRGIEGPVVMDLLVDQEGQVRQVVLVEGPGFGLNEAASGAAQEFKFQPARVNEQAVSVKIRYTYRFVLKNR